MMRSLRYGLILLSLAVVFTLIPIGGANVLCWIAAIPFLAYWATHKPRKACS